ncbi:MAG: Fe-S cluster assembly protein HesB [Nocardioidaceae bacterium]|nr:MAG: Fe-S cluster assembly protein HesB [Nocardioidaceae bacterium]
MAIQIAQDPAADKVLSENSFALLTGMLLDQQFPMERAFMAPAKVLDRFGTLDPASIAAADPEQFKELCSIPPAVHRFPGSMAARIQELARIVADDYAGDAARIWNEAVSGSDLMKRMQALPGFGKQKAQIFVALLAKQLGVRPEGWEKAAGDYALEGYRSVADVTDAESLGRVRAYKQQKKAEAKAAK